MDAAYHNALQRRARLLKELEKTNQFIALYEEFSAAGEENASSETADRIANISPVRPQESLAAQATLDLAPADARKRVVGNPKPAEVIRHVKELLAERGHPMTRRQLLAALGEQGLVIRGANALKVLGTNLWRSDDIVSLEGHGYWLKHRVYGPASYYGGLGSEGVV